MPSVSPGTAPDGRSGDRILIRTGRLLDVRQAVALDRASLLVIGERIDAVVPYGAAEPNHERVLDLQAYTVLPGLIDCHTHLIGPIASGGVAPPDVPADTNLLHGVAHARTILEAGFTTVRDVGTVRAFQDIRLRDAIAAGLVAGPRMACAGLYVTAAGGGADPAAADDAPAGQATTEDALRSGVIGSVQDARRIVERLAAEDADLVKIIVTGGGVVTRPTDPDGLELSPELVDALVRAATDNGLPVAAAAHGAHGIEVAARAGARSIEHGTFASEAALAVLAAADTYLVTDLYSGPWIDARSRGFGWSDEIVERNRRVTQAKVDTFRTALRLGVRIAFGTDSGVFPHGENAGQFREMVAAGMSSWEAIQSATTVAADLLGAAADIGTLDAGRYADLVATAGDPVADVTELTRPRIVVKGGVIAARAA